jgi:hypothetical protein
MTDHGDVMQPVRRRDDTANIWRRRCAPVKAEFRNAIGRIEHVCVTDVCWEDGRQTSALHLHVAVGLVLIIDEIGVRGRGVVHGRR